MLQFIVMNYHMGIGFHDSILEWLQDRRCGLLLDWGFRLRSVCCKTIYDRPGWQRPALPFVSIEVDMDLEDGNVFDQGWVIDLPIIVRFKWIQLRKSPASLFWLASDAVLKAIHSNLCSGYKYG